MARFGTLRNGSFSGAVSAAIWTEIIDNLAPQISTYSSQIPNGNVRVNPGAAKWEGHIVSAAHPHLRIDLQGITEPRDKGQITWLPGSLANAADETPIRYANWQVQFGSQGKNRIGFAANRTMTAATIQDHKGSIAGVFMALGFDFSADDFATALQHSYDACRQNGNTFCVLNPTGAYVEPVQQIQMRFLVRLSCTRRTKQCGQRNNKVFVVNLGDSFTTRPATEVFLLNYLRRAKCPFCDEVGALQLASELPEGQTSIFEQAANAVRNWRFNYTGNAELEAAQ